ncbi:MAG: glycosyltransferase family 4 protein [Planctomycetales bacterium]
MPAAADRELDDRYRAACALAEDGDLAEAAERYSELAMEATDARRQALIASDGGTLAALAGYCEQARAAFATALALDPECSPAARNLATLDDVLSAERCDEIPPTNAPSEPPRTRVAIVSLLFNWPSTGGGIVHTLELAQFLERAGYDVRLIHARYEPWGIGSGAADCPFPVHTLAFTEGAWEPETVKGAFRDAVDAFAPDAVIVTDSWSFKPHLADAVRGHRYFFRTQAMECLCPLNNSRLLPNDGGFRNCPKHQLATPESCRECVTENERWSGLLHRRERAFSGAGTPEYDRLLRRTVAEAEAVLAVNPLIGEMFAPYAKAVRVVPSGFDPARFPWPRTGETMEEASPRLHRVFFAGLTEEPMKGFHVLHAACARLWEVRRDFELVATGDPPGRVDEFTRFIGWQTQAELPHRLAESALLAFPTIAEEALGRSAVEAMGAGIPVVASWIGGLQFTVADGATGLLCEPGNADDLAAKIETLLDDPELRRRLGEAGRKRFEEQFTWDAVIARHYRPLLGAPTRA